MPRLVLANTGTAAYRRAYFDLRAADGLSPAMAEAAGQPEISVDGAAWTSTGIGTLTAIGNGRYYADITQATIATAGVVVETRYKSANTVETPGDTFQVVAFNPNDAVRMGMTSLPAAIPATSGGLPIIGTGANSISTDGAGNVNSNVTQWRASQPNILASGRVDTTIGAAQASVITATSIATDAITATKIAADAITAAAIATGAITAAKFAANAITATVIAADAITDAKVASDVTIAAVTGAVGSVTAGVSVAAGGIDSTSFAAGAIDAAAIAANAIGASELAQDAAREIADEVLDRDIAGGGSGNTRNVRNALRAIRNKVSEAGGTLTVTEEDDATPAWTAAVTRTGGTDPITRVDPA